MRTAFFKELTALASTDPRIFLVVGDLGFGVVEEFARTHPDRFLNAGVAEQNMTAVAAGLAHTGYTVFTYSIANFPTIRCLEQIRNDVCYHELNVKVVAVGGGLAYGALGMTHHATEDLAIMRALPGMTVVAPGDPLEARHATRAIAGAPGPCYLRLGRAGEPVVHNREIDFTLGQALSVRTGADVTLLSTGGMLRTAVDAAALLEGRGISAGVVSVHTVQPLDRDAIIACAAACPVLVTLEEHSLVGGLGSAVAEALADAEVAGALLKRLALPPEFQSQVGSQEYLIARARLTPEPVALAAIDALERHRMRQPTTVA